MIHASDVGLIAIADSSGNLQGFNVAIGGGMGVTHSMKKTYPRLGSIIGFATPDQVIDVCEKVMLTQKDHGDRTNRKRELGILICLEKGIADARVVCRCSHEVHRR